MKGVDRNEIERDQKMLYEHRAVFGSAHAKWMLVEQRASLLADGWDGGA